MFNFWRDGKIIKYKDTFMFVSIASPRIAASKQSNLLLFAMPYIIILITLKKRQVTYGIYVLCRSSGQMGRFRKTSAETLRGGGTHTGRFKIWQYVADIKGRQKAD